MITVYEYPLQMIIPEECNQNSYNDLGQYKHIVYIMPLQAVHPAHTSQPLSQSKRTHEVQ